ncbi:NAD(P)-binding protein [Apiospora phragmitis]|uniref:NAD(P)-binding protein n=1 Tax=Apiospora phragmitis TaxID=2905665 RepID=A0ABR1VE43_9PEZI
MSWTNPPTENRSIAILGAGVLGRRIGAVWAAGGYTVHLRDPDAQQLEAAREYIQEHARDYKADVRSSDLRVETFEELAPAVRTAFVVVECVPEQLPIKQETFSALERLAPADAVLTTNSSSYKSREMSRHLAPATRARVLNMHYMMPPRNRVVELMTCGDTHEAIFPWLLDMLKRLTMVPVRARKESTGFVINRIWAAIKREALMELAEGVATPEDLDAVWHEMFVKSEIPPCGGMDLVGLDTVSFIEQHYIKERGLQTRGSSTSCRSTSTKGGSATRRRTRADCTHRSRSNLDNECSDWGKTSWLIGGELLVTSVLLR